MYWQVGWTLVLAVAMLSSCGYGQLRDDHQALKEENKRLKLRLDALERGAPGVHTTSATVGSLEKPCRLRELMLESEHRALRQHAPNAKPDVRPECVVSTTRFAQLTAQARLHEARHWAAGMVFEDTRIQTIKRYMAVDGRDPWAQQTEVALMDGYMEQLGVVARDTGRYQGLERWVVEPPNVFFECSKTMCLLIVPFGWDGPDKRRLFPTSYTAAEDALFSTDLVGELGIGGCSLWTVGMDALAAVMMKDGYKPLTEQEMVVRIEQHPN